MYRFTPMRHCIYVIPSWIADTLKRHNLQLVDLLNFSKIKSILSMNDLLSIEAAQSFFEQITGVKESYSILYEWISTANEVDKVYITTQLEPLSKDQFQRDTVKARLFTVTEKPSDFVPFEIQPMADLAIGVVIKPGAFAGAVSKDQHLAVIRAILKQLYVYEKHGPVTASPLYLRYLELLSLA